MFIDGYFFVAILGSILNITYCFIFVLLIVYILFRRIEIIIYGYFFWDFVCFLFFFFFFSFLIIERFIFFYYINIIFFF